MTIRVRFHLRERVLYLSAAVLVTGPSVLMAVPFRAVSTAVLMRLPLGASARVDVSEVERIGLGEITQVELYEDITGGVLQGNGAAHPRVVLGVQGELDIIALRVGGGALCALGTAIGAPDHKEDSRKHHDA